jgi:hypothetical protein
MKTLLQGLRYGARRLRLSAQPQVFAKVAPNWLIESPDLVLGPTDRPICCGPSPSALWNVLGLTTK